MVRQFGELGSLQKAQYVAGVAGVAALMIPAVGIAVASSPISLPALIMLRKLPGWMFMLAPVPLTLAFLGSFFKAPAIAATFMQDLDAWRDRSARSARKPAGQKA